MDEIKLKKLISDYKSSHPQVRNKTDKEIISIMCNDPKVKKEDVAQLSTLLANPSTLKMGDSFNFSSTTPSNTQTNFVIVKTKEGKNCNLNKTIELRINKVSSNLTESERSNGFIGKAWSGFKNLTGIGDSSADVRQLLENERKLLNAFNSNTQKRPQIFKELTGLDYTPENLENFLKGKIKLQSEIALDKYKEGQKMVVDITSDIASGVVAYGTAAICIAGGIAAVPFTAGASLGAVVVGIGIAAGAGAVTKVALKTADAYSGGRKYTLEEIGKDATIGGVSGALAPLTLGAGGAVATTTAKVAPKFFANTARYSVEGGMFGAVDRGTRAALEGASWEDIVVAANEGARDGAIAGNVMGHGFTFLGKTVFGSLRGNSNVQVSNRELQNSLSDKIGKEGFKFYKNSYKDLFSDNEALRIMNNSLVKSSANNASLVHYISTCSRQLKSLLADLSDAGLSPQDIYRYIQELERMKMLGVNLGEDSANSILQIYKLGKDFDSLLSFTKLKIDNLNIKSFDILKNYANRYAQFAGKLEETSHTDIINELRLLIKDAELQGHTITRQELKEIFSNIKVEHNGLKGDELMLAKLDEEMFNDLYKIIDRTALNESETIQEYLIRIDKIRRTQNEEKKVLRFNRNKDIIEQNYVTGEAPLDEIVLTPEELAEFNAQRDLYIRSAGDPSTRRGMGVAYGFDKQGKFLSLGLQHYERYNSTEYFANSGLRPLGNTGKYKYPPVIRYLEVQNPEYQSVRNLVEHSFPEKGGSYQANTLKCCFSTPVGSNENQIISDVIVEIHPLSETSKAHFVTGWGREVRYGGNQKFKVIDKYYELDEGDMGGGIRRRLQGHVILQEL